jgi:putative oxidoreductase
MKKLLNINYNPAAFNFALLVMRVCGGILLAAHGYDKLVHFQQYSAQFMNFMGIGAKASLSLAIFSEFFCSMFVILGLFTRVAVIPILISLSVVIFKAHNADFFGKADPGSLYFLIFFTILLVGPGKISIDGAVSK